MIKAKVKIEEFLIEQNETVVRVRRMVSEPIMPGYSVRWDFYRNGEWRRFPNLKEIENDYINYITERNPQTEAEVEKKIIQSVQKQQRQEFTIDPENDDMIIETVSENNPSVKRHYNKKVNSLS